jgi:hypothetical protein
MRRFALLAILLCLSVPSVSAAQVRLMGGVGVSNPMSDLKDVADVGWHAMAGLQLSIAALPVGLRADGMYHSFGERGASPTPSVLSGALSLVVTLPGVGLSPYVLGGLGTYRTSTDGGTDAQSDSGIHGAFGVDIGALSFGGFAEVRLVNVNTEGSGNVRFVTATLGFRL